MVTISNNLAAFLNQILAADITRYGNAARDWGTRESKGYLVELEQACKDQYSPKNEKDSLKLINLITNLIKKENVGRLMGGGTLKQLREALLTTVDMVKLENNINAAMPKCANCGREFMYSEMLTMGSEPDVFFCTICYKPTHYACAEGKDFECNARPAISDKVLKVLYAEAGKLLCTHHKTKPTENKPKNIADYLVAEQAQDIPMPAIMELDRDNPFEDQLNELEPIREPEGPAVGGEIQGGQPLEDPRVRELLRAAQIRPDQRGNPAAGRGVLGRIRGANFGARAAANNWPSPFADPPQRIGRIEVIREPEPDRDRG